MPSSYNRADLVAAIPGLAQNPKVLHGLEAQAQAVTDNTLATTAAVEATQGQANATYLTLSSNDVLPNERVLAIGDGFTLQDGGAGGQLTLRLKYLIKTNGGYRVTFNALADTNLTLPTDGMLATTVPMGPYADDAAAATNGVALGEQYARTDGLVAWRRT